MRDHEDPYEDDPMAVGRGIVFGLVFGATLWLIILGVIWYWLYHS
jgi:hypothetical protein